MSRHLAAVVEDDSYISGDKKQIRIRFFFCPLCDDSGVIKDDNDEPMEACDCAIGEAIRDANGGAA